MKCVQTVGFDCDGTRGCLPDVPIRSNAAVSTRILADAFRMVLLANGRLHAPMLATRGELRMHGE